mmetsp:Transcript_14867/g.31143  ORF Transcript_14867/g.31143 Transcript_14867/m.31143 type:complete len:124 (+) Transcript_14867:1633-2004(+)
MILFILPLVVHDNDWLVSLPRDHLEWPQLDVRLDDGVCKLATNEPLGVKDSVLWIPSYLVLGRITNQTLSICERNIRRSRSVTLVIGNDFDAIVLPDANAGVSRAQIDSDCRLLRHGDPGLLN